MHMRALGGFVCAVYEVAEELPVPVYGGVTAAYTPGTDIHAPPYMRTVRKASSSPNAENLLQKSRSSGPFTRR